jgi:hypothetical protein
MPNKIRKCKKQWRDDSSHCPAEALRLGSVGIEHSSFIFLVNVRNQRKLQHASRCIRNQPCPKPQKIEKGSVDSCSYKKNYKPDDVKFDES